MSVVKSLKDRTKNTLDRLIAGTTLIGATYADYYVTLSKITGPGDEGNPILKSLMVEYGNELGLAIGKVGITGLAVFAPLAVVDYRNERVKPEKKTITKWDVILPYFGASFYALAVWDWYNMIP